MVSTIISAECPNSTRSRPSTRRSSASESRVRSHDVSRSRTSSLYVIAYLSCSPGTGATRLRSCLNDDMSIGRQFG